MVPPVIALVGFATNGFGKQLVAIQRDRLEGSIGTDMSDVTRIVAAIEQGDPRASEQLCR